MFADFRISMVTWNVKSSFPVEDLRKLLSVENGSSEFLPDIYAIGLQEVSVNPLYLLVEDPWVTAIIKILSNYNFVKIKQVKLQGIVLALFCKKQYITSIRDIETSYIRTGLSGYWGNKGAVSIRFSVNQCSVCVVNSHLPAHDFQLQQRINDYNTIVDNLGFTNQQTYRILLHDYIFWCGDLNFRLEELSAERINELIEKAKSATDMKMRQVYIDDLLSKDQLSIVKREGLAFSEFVESTPTFLPTYRFKAKTDEYDYKSRRPAFTDRILYRVNPHVYNELKLQLNQLNYLSCNDYKQSDHKPVTSLFSIRVFTKHAMHALNIVEPIKVTFRIIGSWHVYRDSTVWYHVSPAVQRLQSDDRLVNENECIVEGISTYDWLAMYRSDFCSLDDYVCYTWASCTSPQSTPTFGEESETTQQSNLESNPVDPAGKWFRVVFPDQSILAAGSYRLLYISQNGNVLGMSDPFQVESQ